MDNYIKNLIKQVDKNLKKHLERPAGHPPKIYRAMKYSVFAGGKRIRPVLFLLSARACGTAPSAVMPVACAFEFIHTYSLIHDDLPAMDDDDYRRGKLSSHKKFGEAEAILAGDALLTLAFEAALKTAGRKKTRDSDLIAAVSVMARAAGAGGMVGGQAADISNESKKITAGSLDFIHRKKTGALIAAATEAGALISGKKGKKASAFRKTGQKLGLAFQIIDDILDVTGDEKKLGKRTGKDTGAGKATYPGFYGLEYSRNKARGLINGAKSLIRENGKNTRPLLNLADYFVERTM